MKIDDHSKLTLFRSDSEFPASCCRSRILIAILEHKTEWEYHFYVKQNSLLLKTKNANIVTCCYILFKMENENTPFQSPAKMREILKSVDDYTINKTKQIHNKFAFHPQYRFKYFFPVTTRLVWCPLTAMQKKGRLLIRGWTEHNFSRIFEGCDACNTPIALIWTNPN